jgi:hypothetical protein
MTSAECDGCEGNLHIQGIRARVNADKQYCLHIHHKGGFDHSIRVSLAIFPAFEPFALGPAAPSGAFGGECGGECLERRRTPPFPCGSLVR